MSHNSIRLAAGVAESIRCRGAEPCVERTRYSKFLAFFCPGVCVYYYSAYYQAVRVWGGG